MSQVDKQPVLLNEVKDGNQLEDESGQVPGPDHGLALWAIKWTDIEKKRSLMTNVILSKSLFRK